MQTGMNVQLKFQFTGLHLSDDVNDDVSKTKSKIMELELQFGRNLIENKTKLLFSADELAGMPSDFIEELKKVVSLPSNMLQNLHQM